MVAALWEHRLERYKRGGPIGSSQVSIRALTVKVGRFKV